MVTPNSGRVHNLTRISKLLVPRSTDEAAAAPHLSGDYSDALEAFTQHCVTERRRLDSCCPLKLWISL
jgi:hypothetical protein